MTLVSNFIKINDKYIDLSLFNVISIIENCNIEKYNLNEKESENLFRKRIEELKDNGIRYEKSNVYTTNVYLYVYDGTYKISLGNLGSNTVEILSDIYDSYELAETDVIKIIKAKNNYKEITL